MQVQLALSQDFENSGTLILSTGTWAKIPGKIYSHSLIYTIGNGQRLTGALGMHALQGLQYCLSVCLWLRVSI